MQLYVRSHFCINIENVKQVTSVYTGYRNNTAFNDTMFSYIFKSFH